MKVLLVTVVGGTGTFHPTPAPPHHRFPVSQNESPFRVETAAVNSSAYNRPNSSNKK